MIIMTDPLYQVEAQRMDKDVMLQIMSNPDINISKKRNVELKKA